MPVVAPAVGIYPPLAESPPVALLAPARTAVFAPENGESDTADVSSGLRDE